MTEQVQVEKSLWSELLELLKRYDVGVLNDDVVIVVDWDYWYHNAVYARKYRERPYKKSYVVYEVITRDGLRLEVYYPGDNPSKVYAKVESLHQSLCSCGD